MAVIGCDIPVRQVVGAEELATAKAGIWTKTHFYEKGHYLHAKTFVVAAGNPTVLEFRIDLRPLLKVAGRIHQRLHEEMAKKTGGPVVGFSFSKAWKAVKGTAKKIGKSKLIKAVGKGIKSVATSKLVGTLAAGLAVAVPVVGVPALAAYGAANASIKAIDKGRKLVSTASSAKRTIDKAAEMTTKLTAAKRAAPAAVAAAQANAKASGTAQAKAIALRAKAQAAKAPSAANAAAVKAAAVKQAASVAAQAKANATAAAKNVVAQVVTAQSKVEPVVQAAAKIQAKLADPAVRAKLVQIKAQADSAKKALETVKEKATYGTGAEKLDAQKSAAIVNLVAKNQARIQAMSQQNAGGLPSLLIDAKGRIVPGRFRVVAKSGGNSPDVLYDGPRKIQAGAFTQVSGGFDDDDPDVGCAQAEVSGHLKNLPQRGEVMPPGARVRFFLDRQSKSGKVLRAGHGTYTIKYRPKAKGKYNVAVVPTNDVYAVDERSIRTRRPTNDRFDNVGADRYLPWTIELFTGGKWIPQHSRGAAFATHAEAAKALGWYTRNGYTAQVATFPRVKSQSGSRPRVGASPGSHESVRGRGGGSPFPPPSPRDKRAKDALYAAWLSKHAAPSRKSRSSRVGWSSPPAWAAPSVSGFWNIGCDCEGSQF